MRKAHNSAAAIETNSPEYLTFWQKADTKTLENTLGKLNRSRRGPIHVPLGLKFRFVHTTEPTASNRPNTAPQKVTEKRVSSDAVKLPLLVVSEEGEPQQQQQRKQQRKQRLFSKKKLNSMDLQSKSLQYTYHMQAETLIKYFLSY